MQMPVKATWEYYCPSGKTVKAGGQFCNIYTPYKAYVWWNGTKVSYTDTDTDTDNSLFWQFND